jgi:hypothetical protein
MQYDMFTNGHGHSHAKDDEEFVEARTLEGPEDAGPLADDEGDKFAEME